AGLTGRRDDPLEGVGGARVDVARLEDDQRELVGLGKGVGIDRADLVGRDALDLRLAEARQTQRLDDARVSLRADDDPHGWGAGEAQLADVPAGAREDRVPR